jgi:xanthine dehydrogenase YagR molybdenum-binding subunit
MSRRIAREREMEALARLPGGAATQRAVPPKAAPGTGAVALGDPVPRSDGLAKVTGTARYAAEHPADDLLHGVVVGSTVAKGRIVGFDLEAALALPGVVHVMTHENRPSIRRPGLFWKDMVAPAGTPFRPLGDSAIRWSAQPVALVLAETFEAARAGAQLVRVRYAEEPHATALAGDLERAKKPRPLKAGYSPPPKPRGDADTAYDAAPFRVDCASWAGIEHHNPLELHATTVLRRADGHLEVHDKTQGAQNVRWALCRALGIAERNITVRNAFVGGAFGSGLRPQVPVFLAVMAAMALGRSVRVVLTRRQMFDHGHRPETWQRVRLACDAEGRLQSIRHEAIAETSRHEDFVEAVVNWSGQLYACANTRLGYKLVDLDRATPLDMRAPGAVHGVHALEVAMDELAAAAGIDPLELRIRNHAERNPADDKPFSSKRLLDCYREGAERFGWAGRALAPRSRREGHEWVGWGMATGIWDSLQMVARARAVLHADGRLLVMSAASDIGTGSWTVMAQIAAAAMGMPLENVDFVLGDSRLPFAPVEGGSSHVATVGSAIDGACEKLKRELWRLARTCHRDSPFAGKPFEAMHFDGTSIRLRDDASVSMTYADCMASGGRDRLDVVFTLLPNVLRQRKFTRVTHAAHFCEVRVDEAFGTVRVTRVVTAIDAGRIMNRRLATSQASGSVVWGMSHALHEETHDDAGLGRLMNRSLAEYHVPVNADVHGIEIVFVEESDTVVSRLGAKGVGEIGMVGLSAAISNAVWHATGKRVRDTPMTPNRVMAD